MADKIRSRCWNLLLYPEDSSHMSALDIIRQSFNYVGILHDKDTWTEADEAENSAHKAGELKKPHYHIILKFSQARWNTALASDLGIAVNYLEKCCSFDSSAVYLVHEGFDEKYQYESDLLEGPLVPAVLKLLAPADENARVLELMKMIQAMGHIEYEDLVIKACENGMYGDVRRMGYILSRIIDSHNEKYEREFFRPESEDTRGFCMFEANGGYGTEIPTFEQLGY